MVTLANPNQAPTRMAPIRYSDVDQMPKPSFQPFGGVPGFSGLSQAPMFGGIGGLFNRFSRMDDETYNRGMDRYGAFRERFGGGYQPNMFSSFAGMDDETFSRGMDRLGSYAEQYGQGNPMFRGYNRQPDPRPSQPFIDPPATGGPLPPPRQDGLLDAPSQDLLDRFPNGIPDTPDDIADRGVVGPNMDDFNPGAATNDANRRMNERLRQQGFGGQQGLGGKGGGSQPPQNTPYYGTQFASRMQNPYASGYGMNYQTPRYNQMGYNGTGNPGYSGYASNSGKGGSRSQNPYSGRPAGSGKGGQNNMGTYNMMSSGPM